MQFFNKMVITQSKDQEQELSMHEDIVQKAILTTPNETSWCKGSWVKNGIGAEEVNVGG